MLSKIGNFFSTAFGGFSETLSGWSTAIGSDSFSATGMFSSSSIDSSSSSAGLNASPMVAESDQSFGIGNAWGTACDNQVFAEANYEFPASDFSSSFGAGSSLDTGSSLDSSSSFSSFNSSWD